MAIAYVQKRKKAWRAALPLAVSLPGLLFAASFLILILLGAGSTSEGSRGDDAYTVTGNRNLSEECERYRPLVERYAAQYGMEGFVDVIMAVMMQESGGRVPDVMQSSEYAGMAPNAITDPEVSIDYGVQAIRDAMQLAACTSPAQTELLKLALQGYNYGSGYVSWAKENYGRYSRENALEFSEMMAARLGWRRYGDPLYVEHVFQYLAITQAGDFGGAVPLEDICREAREQLTMLREGWPDMDSRRADVIAKGATRIGKTSYSMWGEDTRSGVDEPRTLDCSSFVAWSFQKAGFTDVPYTSTTGTYISSANFVRISASELVPGDIGLKNTVPAGGENHVGIYVGKDRNGTQMWLHCTSVLMPGSSVISGPRIGYYTNFRIFYRYTGFME